MAMQENVQNQICGEGRWCTWWFLPIGSDARRYCKTGPAMTVGMQRSSGHGQVAAREITRTVAYMCHVMCRVMCRVMRPVQCMHTANIHAATPADDPSCPLPFFSGCTLPSWPIPMS
jgi:hypothetical protein